MGADQTIKVRHIASGDLWAGAEVQVYGLLNALVREPSVSLQAILLNDGKLAEKLRHAGVTVRIIDERRHSFREIASLVRSQLADEKIDILHTHRYKENIIGALTKRSLGIPHLVQTIHGQPEQFSGLRRLKMAAYTTAHRFVTRRYFDRIITVSDDIARTMKSIYDPGRMVTIHNAVDIDAVIAKRPAADLRRELGVSPDQPLIGNVGRMVPVKGFDLFLQFAKQLHALRPAVRFLLVGDGPQKEVYEKLAGEYGLAGVVHFTGFRDDVWDIINALDVFVLTSRHEGVPVVMLEAMLLQKAVVATAVGGVPEVIHDGISGFLVASGDLKSLLVRTIMLLDDPEKRHAIGQSARVCVIEEFSITSQKERVLQVYRDLTTAGVADHK